MTIIIDGNNENISFIVDKNHFKKISDLDDKALQERAIETLKAIISKVEEEANKTQEE